MSKTSLSIDYDVFPKRCIRIYVIRKLNGLRSGSIIGKAACA